MNWTQIGRLLRTLFLLRVPLITLALLAGAGPLALTSEKTLLGNLFDVRVVLLSPSGPVGVEQGRSAWYLFSVSFAAFLVALTAVAVINLVIHYGRDRFADPALDLNQKRPLLTFLSGLAASLPPVFCTAWHSRGGDEMNSQIHGLYLWWMPLLALVSALVLVFGAKVVQLLLTDPRTTPHPPPYLIFPVYLIPSFERFFDRLYCWNGPTLIASKKVLNRISQWPLEVFRCAGQGYLIDCNAPAGSLALRSGHVFALALSILASLFYFIIGYAKGKIDDKPAAVPALAFLLLFVIVLCWTLGALAFFFDRYRVPLLGSIGVLILTTALVPQSDHIYRTERERSGKTPWRMQPSDLIRQRASEGKHRIVLVATAGGGIQAAAWTARVLRGLEEECSSQAPHVDNKDIEPLCDFRRSMTLISGVSGGSLGAIAYARSFTDAPVTVAASDVPANAAQPALDEVGWAWTNPDVGRALLPWFRTQYVDRGWALEEKWSAVHKLYQREQGSFLERVGWRNHGRDTFLGDWAREVQTGMPALLLNATVVEKGQPLIFSSTEFPRPGDSRGLLNFYDLYPGFDIRVNTAARLSASFPYVAPAARSNAKAVTVGDYHIVDGGYYDNYGVNSLLGWLEDAIDNLSEAEVEQDLSDVLILQIRPFGDVSPEAAYEGGWAYQFVAPIHGLLDVRDVGQSARDHTEVKLFAQAHSPIVHIWGANLFYPSEFDKKTENCVHAPLSWKLSFEQTQCIITAWGKLLTQRPGPVSCILAYLENNSTAVLKEEGCILEADQ
jgi:predicted acylesterase/phospholipase RssA